MSDTWVPPYTPVPPLVLFTIQGQDRDLTWDCGWVHGLEEAEEAIALLRSLNADAAFTARPLYKFIAGRDLDDS